MYSNDLYRVRRRVDAAFGALLTIFPVGLQVVHESAEPGHIVGSRDFDQREDHMIPLLFQQGGGRTTSDLAIRVLGGRGVGGSTIHNTNLCKRTPNEVLDLWARKYGVENAGPEQMAPSFEAVERDLSVLPMRDEDVNGKKAVGVKVTHGKHTPVTLYFDKETGLLAKSETKVKDEFQGWKEVPEEVYFGDYKESGGKKFFGKMKIVRDGKTLIESTLSEQKVADKLDAKLFEKP